jgi:hypothetical protein
MSITIISKQILHCKGVVIDAAGHKWACHKSGKSEAIAAFVKRLYETGKQLYKILPTFPFLA